MRWHTVHIYYHDENTDALLLQAVRPLCTRLAGDVDAVSWTRHWRQGPHLRLNVRTDDDTAVRTVLPAAQEVVGGWLRHHPSTRVIDQDTVLAEHRRLAVQEREQGPLIPWHPNNSLRLGPYDRRVEVLGTEEMADLLADFYADTTPMSFAMTEHGPGAKRLMLAFDLIVTTAHALTATGIAEGFRSLRSHAEAYLHGRPEHGPLREGWDRHHQRHADVLATRLAGIVTALDEDRDVVPFVRDWATLLRRYRRRAGELLSRQQFFMPDFDDTGLAGASPFHQELVADPGWAAVRGSTGFALYRLMINYTYLHLTRLGIGRGQRFLLCHLAANTVEEQGIFA